MESFTERELLKKGLMIFHRFDCVGVQRTMQKAYERHLLDYDKHDLRAVKD